MAERLPLTLRAYALLTAAARPFAHHVLNRRLNRGKEHPQRMAERRGETAVTRPAGVLVWVHGASDQTQGAEMVPDAGRLTVRIGAWLKDTEQRALVAAASKKTVDLPGGALERTLAALEPYLMQLRLEQRDA